MMIEPISLLLGVLAGLVTGTLAGAGFLRARNRELERRNAELEQIGARFDTLAQEALSRSHEQFLRLAESKLRAAQGESAHDLEKRQKAIADLVGPVTAALKTMDEKLAALEKARSGAYVELQTHMKTMAEDQIRLRRETASLVQALRAPATRGQWGEMQLRRCLEMAGMQRGIHYDEQVSAGEADNRQRPDVVIRLSGGKCIVIDAKAPIEGFLDAVREGASQEERDAALERHARHVREHLRKLGAKSYWAQFESPEFVVMFLPGESYFSAALEKDPGLIEAGVDNRVIPATPTTLISLLKAVMYGWRQEEIAENAKAISDLGATLYERIAVYTEHMQGVGNGLSGAIRAYNRAVASLESRVLPSARRFRDLRAAPESREIPEPETVDLAVKSLSAPLADTEAEEDAGDDAGDDAAGNPEEPELAKTGNDP